MKRVLNVLCGTTAERPAASAHYTGWLYVDETENMMYRCDGTQWVALDGKKT